MSLDDFKGGVGQKPGVRYKKDRLNKDRLCPYCGNESKKLRDNEWRCEEDDCEVNYYLTTPFEIDLL